MYPLARFAKVLAAAPTRAKLDPLADSVVSFRVWPGDLDNNLHLNNGRYLTLMDLARWDMVVRTGLGKELLKRRWHPVVGSSTIRHRKSLNLLQRFDLRTRLIGWNDQGFFIEQRFERGGEVHAIGVIWGVFLGPEGKVPASDVVHAVSPGAASPPLPAWVETWARSQEALSAELRAGPPR